MQTMADLESVLLSRRPESDMEPTLARVSGVMDLLGSPQNTFRAIHITGTNGKSSTARMAETMLRASGLRTGLYTSPHLHSFAERICVDGEPLAEERVLELYEEIEPYLTLADQQATDAGEPPLTFFEVVTILAFAAFADAPVDVAVVEVGLGGAWDATNVMDGDVCVVTPISLDHTRWLGHEVTAIAEEKSGIIKSGSVAVLAAQSQPVAEVLLRRCADVGARVLAEGMDFDINARVPGVSGQLLSFRLGDVVLPEVFLPLLGRHQAQNAVVATAAVSALLTEDLMLGDDVVAGLESVAVPARLEQLGRDPTVIVDTAHNPGGAAVLADALGTEYAFSRMVGVLAILDDKDIDGVFAALAPVLDEVVLAPNSNERAASVPVLRNAAAKYWAPSRILEAGSVADALRTAAGRIKQGERGGIVATGSIATAADAREALGHRDVAAVPPVATVGLEGPQDDAGLAAAADPEGEDS